MNIATKFVWTPEIVAEVRRRAEAGESAGQIAAALGVTRNMVVGKCIRARIRLGVGRAGGTQSARANSLVSRAQMGKTGMPTLRPKPMPMVDLTKMRSAPVELAVEKAEAYLASPARRHAFDPDHAPEGARKVRLHELERGQCKWPLYEDGPQLFCGCAVSSYDQDGRPHAYCEVHRAMATREVRR